MQAIARTRNGRSSSRSCPRLVAAALVAAGRVLCGRAPEPTAAVIDSQSVNTTESGGPRGYDAAKKIKGRSVIS